MPQGLRDRGVCVLTYTFHLRSPGSAMGGQKPGGLGGKYSITHHKSSDKVCCWKEPGDGHFWGVNCPGKLPPSWGTCERGHREAPVALQGRGVAPRTLGQGVSQSRAVTVHSRVARSPSPRPQQPEEEQL